MSSLSSVFNSMPVIPPIITSETDRRFLTGLDKWIESEMSQINQADPEQRYVIYKEAFDKVISLICLNVNIHASVRSGLYCSCEFRL